MNSSMSMPMLTPDVMARLGGLEVKARTIVEGTLAGLHRGRRSGTSIDFAEHRSYTPGDDVRHLDWKVFGKRDRLYVRQFEEETRLRAWLAMDISRSMSYRSQGTALSKLQYANCLAAALGWVICQQQDEIGLATFSRTRREWLPPRSGIAGLRTIFSSLEAYERQSSSVSPSETETVRREMRPEPLESPATATVAGEEDWSGLRSVADRISERAVVFLFTDGLGDLDRLILAIKRLRSRKCDTRLIHVLDPAETSFPFDDNIAFVDLETAEKRTVMARSIRAAYLDELHAFLERLERETSAQECAYRRVETSETLDLALLRVLSPDSPRTFSRPPR